MTKFFLLSILSLALSTANANNEAVFLDGQLSIPVIHTEQQLGKYEHIEFQLAKDGRWDLVNYSVAKQATVKSIKLNISESFPVQVHIEVQGYLPNACYTLGNIHSTIDNSAFTVAINMQVLHPDLSCTQALVPFNVKVPLDVADSKAGIYTVNVNGIHESFELSVDNF